MSKLVFSRNAGKSKVIIIVISLLLSSNIVFADEIERIITLNGLADTEIMALYKSGVLEVETNTPNKIILVNNKITKPDEIAEKAMFWYRAMGIKEFKEMDIDKYRAVTCVSNNNSYCGITPQYTYAKSYLTIKNPGVILEFSTTEPGMIYKDFTTNHGCKIKAEGGGTYGLGPTGNSSSCTSVYNQQKNGLGLQFNAWLLSKEFNTYVAYVLLPKVPKINAAEVSLLLMGSSN
jgi:hypothetical protein